MTTAVLLTLAVFDLAAMVWIGLRHAAGVAAVLRSYPKERSNG